MGISGNLDLKIWVFEEEDGDDGVGGDEMGVESGI